MPELGYYTIPVILSAKGIESQTAAQLDKAMAGSGAKSGKAWSAAAGKSIAGDSGLTNAVTARQKAMDKAADAAGRLRAAEASLKQVQGTSNAARIVAAEEKVAAARRKSTAAAQDAEHAVSRLRGGTSGAGGLFAGMSSEISSSVGGLGRMSGLLTGVAGAATGATAGVAAIAGAAVLVTAKLYQMGSSFDETFDKIRIQTGKSGGDLKALEKATLDIARRSPESIGTIGTTVAGVSRALHLTGSDLEAVSHTIGTLGRKTGEAVDIRALGQAFRGFGVPAGEQVEQLNSLFRAFQSTGIGVNELLASVVKGGPQLRQFGLNLGESAGLLGAFEQGGVDSDKALTGLTKAFGAFSKDGRDAKTALTETINEVKRLIAAGNDPAAGALAVKVFGAKAGPTILDQIKSGALDLEAIKGAVSSTGDTIQAAAQDTDDFAEKWQVLKNNVSAALQPAASAVFDFVNGALASLATWVTTHQPQIIGFFTTLGEVTATAGQAILIFTSQSATALAQLVNIFGDATGGILRAASAVQRLMGHGERADELSRQADAAFGWADGIYRLADAARKGVDQLEQFKGNMSAAGERAANAARLTVALGDAVATLPDGKTITIENNTPEVQAKLEALGFTVQNLPDGKITITPQTDQARAILDAWRAKETGQPVSVAVVPTIDPEAKVRLDSYFDQQRKMLLGLPGAPAPAAPPPFAPLDTGGRAAGGVFGAFSRMPGSAIIQPATQGLIQWAEPTTGGEAYIPLAGGQRSRQIWAVAGHHLGIPGFDAGAVVGAGGAGMAGWGALYQYVASLQGTPYSQATRNDCSGMASKVINVALGLPPSASMFTTQTEGSWLQQHGFIMGAGPAGSLRVGWYNHGSGTNDGHTALTLPDGTNVESGGSHGAFLAGAGAAGADNGQFDQHAFLPANPQGPPYGGMGGGGLGAGGVGGGGGPGGVGMAGGGVPGGATAGINPATGEQGYFTPDAKAVRDANARVADADARVAEAEAQRRELAADAKDSERIASDNQLTKAKREADDARAGLAEAQQGKFTPGGGRPGTGPGGQDISGVGGQMFDIGKQFMKDTFGFGTLLPDIDKFPPLAFLDGLLSKLLGGGGGSGSFGALGGMMGGGMMGMGGIGGGGGSGMMGVDGTGGYAAAGLGMIPNFAPGGVAPPQSASPEMFPGVQIGGQQQMGRPPGPVDNSVNVNVQGFSANDVTNKVVRQLQWAPRVQTNTPVGA